MAVSNHTTATHFILLGLTARLELELPLFVMILLIYVMTLVGNLGIICLIRIDIQLHTPMYFFLINLSIVDLCYSSVFAPRMLVNFLVRNKTISFSASISFAGCLIQLYFYIVFAAVECYLLAAMAHDRYVAICNPLRYPVIMSKKVCVFMLSGSYVAGFSNALILVGSALKMSFCRPNIVAHFFCDGPPLIKLACSDTRLNLVLIFVFTGFNEVTTTSVVLISYGCILSTILRIRSAKGRSKAFSTCASHLAVVTIFYGTLLFMYLRPSSSYSLGRDKIISVFYVVVTPMLNPLIYSLRNKEVKDALKRAQERITASQQ
ncbi:O1020 protein, partial [Nothocercus nigrocapillus]|nr:O1020 protein [Nothocercus nigrocapillus]